MKKIFTCLYAVLIAGGVSAQWNGNPVAGGTPLTSSAASEQTQIPVTDGAGGVIAVFEAYDNNTGLVSLQAQRVNNNGLLQWGNAGSPVSIAVGNGERYLEHAIPDGNGGVFISWLDYRDDGINGDVFMQHLNSAGTALWSTNGIKITNTATNREKQGSRLVQDGNGGVIVAWSESVYNELNSLTTYAQIFAQKYNSAGASQWTSGGVQVCTAAGLRAGHIMIPDGSGGVLMVFTDARNSVQAADDQFDNLDLYAQRLGSNGALQLGANGAAVNTRPYNQTTFFEYLGKRAGVPDGSGGLVFVFDDFTGDNSAVNNMYAQKINNAATIQWAAAGIQVSTADSTKYLVNTISDGAGGIVVLWNDNRNGVSFFNAGLYTQRILSNGTPAWMTDGIELSTNTGGFYGFGSDVIADGSGNFIYSFNAEGANFSQVLVAQKLNGAGIAQWGATPRDVCTNEEAYPYFPLMVGSSSGAAIVTWMDARIVETAPDIWAQKISATGDLGGGTITTYVTIANGSWGNAATWQGGQVPPSTADVIIRHAITVSANASCNSLKVEKPSGSITVTTGVNLAVLH
jgi:hypothetical protein